MHVLRTAFGDPDEIHTARREIDNLETTTLRREMGKNGESFRERLSSKSGRIQKRWKKWRKQQPWNGQARTRPGWTDPGWRTKEWDEWCGREKNHPKKDGPDGEENCGRRTTSYHPHGRYMSQGLWKQVHTILSEAQHDRWVGKGYHLGTNKKVFDSEFYASY